MNRVKVQYPRHVNIKTMDRLYLEMLVVGLLGMLLSILRKFASQRAKAIQANIHFNAKEYARLDWPVWLCNVIAIAIVMYFTKYWLDWKPWVIRAVLPLFATVGYVGSDLLISFLGAANKRINAIIDAKTTAADLNAGTIETPTKIQK